jgi:polyisoprenoid-binding protein YceI
MRFSVLSLLALGLGASLFLLPSPRIDGLTPPAAASYSVDAVHSALIFEIGYSGVSTFYGRFNEFSGTFAVDEAKLEDSTFDITVKTESVDTRNERRDNHLRSPDFFNSKQHPEIRFVSKKVTKGEGKKLAVTGELTLRGVSKEVTADVVYGGKIEGRRGTRAGFDGTLKIKREDFGVEFGQGQLGSEVTIRMGLTGTAQ